MSPPRLFFILAYFGTVVGFSYKLQRTQREEEEGKGLLYNNSASSAPPREVFFFSFFNVDGCSFGI